MLRLKFSFGVLKLHLIYKFFTRRKKFHREVSSFQGNNWIIIIKKKKKLIIYANEYIFFKNAFTVVIHYLYMKMELRIYFLKLKIMESKEINILKAIQDFWTKL